jgi:ribonuclease D
LCPSSDVGGLCNRPDLFERRLLPCGGKIMKVDVRSFTIRQGAEAREDEQKLSRFLRSVEVHRMEMSYADGWQILVVFEDLRGREEAAQIVSAIQGALNSWRANIARQAVLDRHEVLSDHLLNRIARNAPTTEVELSGLLGNEYAGLAQYASAIVAVVKETMTELTGTTE